MGPLAEMACNLKAASPFRKKSRRMPGIPSLPCEVSLCHEMSFMVHLWSCVTVCLAAQHVIPSGTHWFFRGCLFYLSMVLADKTGYQLLLKTLKPERIIPPGHKKRKSSGKVPLQEMVAHWIQGMCCRAFSFSFRADALLFVLVKSMLRIFLWTILWDL